MMIKVMMVVPMTPAASRHDRGSEQDDGEATNAHGVLPSSFDDVSLVERIPRHGRSEDHVCYEAPRHAEG